jgi:protoporphyrin/coproporphyrin ferrochelatase
MPSNGMKDNNMSLTGILLVNLGTPQSPRPWDVFRYLNEFLTDGRVIDYSWIARQLLVRGLIVPLRFLQSAKQYQLLWTTEGSPLLVHGKSVQIQLQNLLGEDFKVVLAMRYQTPSIEKGLKELQAAGVKEIIVFSLFPQYASATTGSVHQKVMECLKDWQVIPKLTLINSYYDHPALIEAFCTRAREQQIESYDHILFSFHGLPERHIRKADPTQTCLKPNCCQSNCGNQSFCYKAQCYATARAIAKRLSLSSTDYTVCFQSRLGKDPWIQPYALETIEQRAACGDKRLLVFSPAFVCDCLETTCEIGLEYAHEFRARGGEVLQLVEGLNSHPLWIQAIKEIMQIQSVPSAKTEPISV